MFNQRVAKREVHGDAQAVPEVVRHSRYPARLSVYSNPPDLEVSIEEFETFALDRLQVLKSIEDAQLRARGEEDMRRRVGEALEKHLPMHTNRSKLPLRQLMAERRKDHVSHFILRLAFSRTEELRGWFLRYECALLKHRFKEADLAEKQELLALANLRLKHLSPAERDAKLGEAGRFYSMQEQLFEVDFERVLDLVSRSQVVLRGGKAFVPQMEVSVLLIHEFRQTLTRALGVCAKALPQMGEDERLVPVLQNLSNQTARSEYQSTGAAGVVNADNVDGLEDNFPLCMRHLHTQLLREHHLRHGGRMQFGLFLKGIGLNLQEALVYWRRAFSNMTDDQFQKGYAYNIRHNYGMEGKRADYTPYSCHRVIMSNPPGPGDHHGCPYRHFSAERLRTALYKDALSDTDVREVSDLAKAGHYQVACTRHLEIRLQHRQSRRPQAGSSGQEPSDGARSDNDVHVSAISSPNQYFDLCIGNGKPADNPAHSRNGGANNGSGKSQQQQQQQSYSYS